jgi:uncharacterized membrane protein YciS (DUF1049 family)
MTMLFVFSSLSLHLDVNFQAEVSRNSFLANMTFAYIYWSCILFGLGFQWAALVFVVL